MKFCWIILATSVLYIGYVSAENKGEHHQLEKRSAAEEIQKKRQQTLDKIRAEIDAVTQAPCIPEKSKPSNPSDEGDYEEGDYEEGDYEEGDYEEGDYEEGDYEEGDYEEGEYGDYEEGDYDEGEYDEGEYEDYEYKK